MGCPRCNSGNLKQYTRTPLTAYLCLFVGLVGAPVSLICGPTCILFPVFAFLFLVSFCLGRREGKCRDCGWKWRV